MMSHSFRARLALEAFEDRLVPSTLTVTSSADDGSSGTLRAMVAQANADAASGHSDTIKFASSLNGQTITLTQGTLEWTAGGGSVTFNGGNKVTISGSGSSNVCQVDSGAHVTFSNCTFEDGSASDGGALFNDGWMSVNCCTFSGNYASNDGGAIYNDGWLKVNHCTFNDNYADYGGAIANEGSASVCSSSFYGNYAYYDGGAIWNDSSLSVSSCSFKYNYTYSYSSGSGNGGAIASEGSVSLFGGTVQNNASLKVSGCSFSHNSAYDGGAIYNFGHLSASHNSFSGNYASDSGGNIFNA